MYKLCLLIFFISSFGFSQNLEEAIYTAAETFINNKTEASLNLLNAQESSFKTQVKTEEEQLALVFLQCHKGYYLDAHSKLEAAIASFEEASKRFNDHELSNLSDFDITENCLKPLGNLYIKTGDITNAESTIKQYIFLAEKDNNIAHRVGGIINLTKLFQSIGKHPIALKIIDDALKIPNIPSDKKQKLKNLKVYSLTALKQFDEALKFNKSLESSMDSKFIQLKNSYQIESQKGNYNQALNYFIEAKKQLETQKNISKRSIAKFYVEEAQLHYLLNNFIDAEKSLHHALNILLPIHNNKDLPDQDILYPENTFIDIFDLYAVLQTDTRIALESYNLSFHVSDLLEYNWTSQEDKVINQTANRLRSEKCIDLLYQKHYKTKDTHLLFEAFQYAEKNKASILKERAQKERFLKRFPKDSLLKQELKLLSKQERLTSLMVKEQLGNSQSSKINQLSRDLVNVSFQLKKAKTAILKTYPEINDDTLSIQNIQHKLAKDKAILVEYFYGKHTLYQFVISEKHITLNSLSFDDDSKKVITDFIHLFDNAAVINNNISAFTEQAFKVYQLLNLKETNAYKNAVIIPDGLLSFVPFEALLTSATKTSVFSKMPFVVKNQNIIYNTNTTLFLSDFEKNKDPSLLGVFPVFENTNQKLTYSINEAKAIDKVMESSILLKAEATKANFIDNASKFDILHLSTHASSGGNTKPASIELYDGTLLLNDLYPLNLKSDLVVLSACETGIGVLYKGAGAMSMARGFQYAGVKNLLFSLWQINDLSTAIIMEFFYKNYSGNHSAYLSNQQSKLDYLQNENISNIKKSPYYWSAFVFYGTIDEHIDPPTILYILGASLFIMIIVLLILKLKKYYGKDAARISS
jgi:CHAT domain-containing protein